MKIFLQSLRKTLDQVEVRGKENLDMMLGCMILLDSKIAEIIKQEAKEAQESAEAEGGANDNHNEQGNDA